jgi:hypothetical protein
MLTSKRPSPRRLALLAVIVAAVLLPAPGAAAAVSLPTAPQVTAAPNGRVHAIVRIGDTVYLGGSFTAVRRPDGTSAARNRLAAFKVSTGQLTSWNPNANGTVLALAASSDGTRVFAGGDFTAVGGRTRNRLAKLDSVTGAVSSWRPSASSTVRALALKGSRLYAGGTFSTMNGASVNRLAAVDVSSGAVATDFKPRPNAGVRSLAVAPDGTRLYVAGSFTTIGGTSRRYLAAVSPSSGSARSWAPNPGWFAYAVTVSSDGSRIFAGGAGTGGHIASWSPSSNTPRWDKTLDGDVNAVALTGGALYLGGHFHTVADRAREKLAALDPATGAVDPWNPGANSVAGVYAVRAGSNALHVGGDFTVVGGRSQPRYAQFPGTP